MKQIYLPITLLILTLIISCNKDVKTFNDINFSFNFDETQVRLDSHGDISSVPAGHGAQSPSMHSMSIHYLELSPDEFTPYKEGNILYKAVETYETGAVAIDFDSSIISDEGVVFYKVNLTRLLPGTYNYVRASVAYQNYDITFNVLNIPIIGNLYNQSGTVASFIGFNTYIRTLKVRDKSITINDDKAQGFWAFETNFSAPYDIYNAIYTGQSPASATTVVNPLFATSPIPPGSCVVTGKFATPLVITGDETTQLYITLSFSTNTSFEWVDTNGNNEWDIDASDSSLTEQVVDMGVRGMIPDWYFGQ